MSIWTTTASGLKYYDFRFSDGTTVSNGDLLEIHYRVAMDLSEIENGPFVENSWELHQPIQIFLGKGELIKGLDEGIEGMKIAGERRFIVPASLAFGERGIPNKLGSDLSLIYDVYVVDIIVSR